MAELVLLQFVSLSALLDLFIDIIMCFLLILTFAQFHAFLLLSQVDSPGFIFILFVIWKYHCELVNFLVEELIYGIQAQLIKNVPLKKDYFADFQLEYEISQGSEVWVFEISLNEEDY